MKNTTYYFCFFLFTVLNKNIVECSWISSIGGYLGYSQQEPSQETEIYEQTIPYEVSTTDESFIKEAAKLTDLALSELDSCQHRVIIKLKTACDKLNDEQLAKMAVHLLNCQSWVEGRTIYPCTDEMSIKDCTISMDSDTWTSYHLMSNRARAVCYTVRQSHFRGLAEYTVNRLMEAAKNQLQNLGDISTMQESLKDLSEKTYFTLKEGQKNLFEQQDDLKKTQFVGQLAIEDNIRRLADEKRLIRETHDSLVSMTKALQVKLEDSLNQLEDQSDRSKINHRELINDLLVIQEKTKDIFERIEHTSSVLLQQNDDFNRQYQSTFKSLQEMNKTVNDLVVLVKGSWSSLEQRLTWIVTALGGTDAAVDRIYLILWHSAFMLLAMLTCAFLTAKSSTRFVVALLPPLNLAVALHGRYQHLDFLSLIVSIGSFIVVQTLILWVSAFKPAKLGAVTWQKQTLVDKSTNASIKNCEPVSSSVFYEESNFEDENEDRLSDFNMTPPASRIGDYINVTRSRTPLTLNSSFKSICSATTRAGTPCKINSLPGRGLCHRHLGGSSVMGSI